MMRNFFKKHFLIIGMLAMAWSACKTETEFINGTPSPYIANLDLRKLYRGGDVQLTQDAMAGAVYLRGQVISDHSAGNLPEGLLFVQNARKISATADSLRGIAINIGQAAADYMPGDSVQVRIEGGVLKRVDGILQITGLDAAAIERKATGVPLRVTNVSAVTLALAPENFESCLAIVYNGNFEPNIGVEKLEGIKTFNEGSGDMQMNVKSSATFKDVLLPWSAIIQGIMIPTAESNVPKIWPRIRTDFTATSIVVDPNIPLGPHPAIITGYFANPSGSDANHEYIQFMATQDLDFRQTPFSVTTTNNAGASTPQGPPVNGWVTGGKRSYKFNITRGTVAKGTYFYVGGYKLIAGSTSTDISRANWVVSKLYNTDETGDDGIGEKTANLLANSGNAAGVAIFSTTNVDRLTVPSDVIFYAGTGNAFADGYGYAICDNDYFSRYDSNGNFQPFYRQGTNTTDYGGNPTDARFTYLGGVYDATAQRWTTKRSNKTVPVPKASELPVIEEISDATKVVN
jgi:hypothetical protein